MAVQFLTGLDVSGNINLNSNQLQNVIIQPLGADPTGVAGKIYYNSSSNKLRLYDGSAWVDLTTGGQDTNTTYDLTATGAANTTATLNLVASNPASTDSIVFTGTGTTTVTRAGSTFTINSADTNVGTVTDVLGGTGISISGTSTITPTVNIDYTGVDNAILVATAATPDGEDTVWFSDATDNRIKKALISSMPGFGKDGTVTSVATSAGLTGGTITGSGTLEVQYVGAANVVLSAPVTGAALADADSFIVSDATTGNAFGSPLSDLKTYINAGAGSVTSVDVSGGTTGLTTSGGPVTTTGTITLAGTLAAGNGGTGQSVYTVGDILYASATDTLTKLGIGSTGQVLKVASGIPSWATDANAGGTVTSIGITETGSALTITNTPITSSGDINIAGAGNNTQVILGDLTLGSYTQGTVTSVATGAGLKGGTITATGTVEVDYGTTGLIQDAPLMGQVPDNDDLILIQDVSPSVQAAAVLNSFLWDTTGGWRNTFA